VVQLNLLKFEVVANGVNGGERLRPLDEDLHVIEPLVPTLYKVKNEVMIGDGLTQGTKVIGHALHPTTVVADIEISMLEGMEPGIELQNSRLTIAEELSLDRKPRLACSLCWLPNDLVEIGGEGVEDPGHINVVQSSPIDRRIGYFREDVIIEGVATKREKHEVVPPLVVG
jgi:hypothetical protein